MSKENLPLPTDLDIVAFISKEAHDLKSPFNRILGFTKMVMKGMSGPITDMQKDDLTIVYQNSTQAMAMMSNLVDMSRLSRGEKAFSPVEADLKNLLAQTLAYWKQNKAIPEVEIELVTPEGEPKINADESLLRQGLLNWLLYVIEYVQPPAKVTFSVENSGAEYHFNIHSEGKKNIGASEVEMTMSAFISQHILALHGGKVLSAEGDETGAIVEFVLPKP